MLTLSSQQQYCAPNILRLKKSWWLCCAHICNPQPCLSQRLPLTKANNFLLEIASLAERERDGERRRSAADNPRSTWQLPAGPLLLHMLSAIPPNNLLNSDSKLSTVLCYLTDLASLCSSYRGLTMQGLQHSVTQQKKSLNSVGEC